MNATSTTHPDNANPRGSHQEVFMHTRLSKQTKVAGWIIVTTFLTFAVASQMGCTLSPSPYDEHDIVALFPAAGAAAVPQTTPIRIDAGWAHDGDALEARLAHEDGTIAAMVCHRAGDDAQWFECERPGKLDADTTYTLSAGSNDAPVTSTFTTAAPEGRGYEIGSSMSIEKFGSEAIAADQISGFLADAGPMVMVAAPDADGSETWHWGPGRRLPDSAAADYAAKQDVGYPVALNVTQDADLFHGWAEHVYMPIELEGDWHYIRLDEVELNGTFLPGSTTIAGMEIEALVTNTTVQRLADLFDEDIADLIIAVCRPDVDTDGDGEDDALTFRLVTAGAEVDIH